MSFRRFGRRGRLGVADESDGTIDRTNCVQEKVEDFASRCFNVKYADISEEETNGFAVILNAAYKTLSDRQTREPYLLAVIDFPKTFLLEQKRRSLTARPIVQMERRGRRDERVFVDESECIGCGNCAQYASKTFSMDVDKDYGRARVINQWADDSETIEIAIDMCPVDCIWFVKRNQLAALEHCMKFCPREDPGIMGRRREVISVRKEQSTIHSALQKAS